MFHEINLLKSHSTSLDSFISSLILSNSSSDKVSIFFVFSIQTFSSIFCADALPIPYIYVKAISACFQLGKFIQAILAILI
jgi:hypothetical protein